MTWSEITILVAAGLLLLLWWVWVAASRLDRLHRKVAGSRATLDNQLVRRASVAAELASSGCLDPVSSVLVGEAAWSALEAGDEGGEPLVPTLGDLGVLGDLGDLRGLGDRAGTSAGLVARDLAESELSSTVRTALAEEEEVREIAGTPPGAELLDALAAAWYRVELSRRFHNEAVAQAQRMRRNPGVRWLRLAGHAPVPQTVEIDDTWPPALPRPGQGE